MKPILFMPSNDAMAEWMKLITTYVPHHTFGVIQGRNEGAPEILKGKKLQWYSGKDSLDFSKYSAVVLGNDWGVEENQICMQAPTQGCRTICVQEGTVVPPYTKKYKTCMHFLPASRLWAETMGFVKTGFGMPAIDMMGVNLPPAPRPVVMVNLNYAYNQLDGWRHQFIAMAMDACRETQAHFFFSVHPRDPYELPEGIPWFKSNPAACREHVTKSAVLVTRNSTVIYYAMQAGRQVIFFDPDPKRPTSIFEFYPHSALQYAHDKDSLAYAIQMALEKHQQGLSETDMVVRNMFLLEHLSANRGFSGEVVANEIIRITNG